MLFGARKRRSKPDGFKMAMATQKWVSKATDNRCAIFFAPWLKPGDRTWSLEKGCLGKLGEEGPETVVSRTFVRFKEGHGSQSVCHKCALASARQKQRELEADGELDPILESIGGGGMLPPALRKAQEASDKAVAAYVEEKEALRRDHQDVAREEALKVIEGLEVDTRMQRGDGGMSVSGGSPARRHMRAAASATSPVSPSVRRERSPAMGDSPERIDAEVQTEKETTRPPMSPVRSPGDRGPPEPKGVSFADTAVKADQARSDALNTVPTSVWLQVKREVSKKFEADLQKAQRTVTHREQLLEYVRKVYYRDVFKIREHLFNVEKNTGVPGYEPSFKEKMPSSAVLNELMKLFNPDATFHIVEDPEFRRLERDSRDLIRERAKYTALQDKCITLVQRHQRLSATARAVAQRADNSEHQLRMAQRELVASQERALSAEKSLAMEETRVDLALKTVEKERDAVRKLSIGLQVDMVNYEEEKLRTESRMSELEEEAQQGKEAQDALNEAMAEMKDLQATLLKLTAQVEEWRPIVDEAERLRKQQAEFEVTKQKLEEEQKARELEAKEHANTVATLNAELEQLKNQVETYKKNAFDTDQQLGAQIEGLNELVRTKTIQINDLKSEKLTLSDTLDREKAEHTKARNKARRLEAELDSARERLYDSMAKHTAERSKYEDEVEKVVALGKTISDLKTTVSELRGQVDNLSKYKGAVGDLRAQVKRLREALSTARTRTLRQTNSIRAVHDTLEEVVDTGILPGQFIEEEGEDSDESSTDGGTDSDETVTTIDSDMSADSRNIEGDAAAMSIGDAALALSNSVFAVEEETHGDGSPVPSLHTTGIAANGGTNAELAATISGKPPLPTTSTTESDHTEQAGSVKSSGDDSHTGSAAPSATSRKSGTPRTSVTPRGAGGVTPRQTPRGGVPSSSTAGQRRIQDVEEVRKQALREANRAFAKREKWRRTVRNAARQAQRQEEAERADLARRQAAAVALNAAEIAGVDPLELTQGTEVEDAVQDGLNGAPLPSVALPAKLVQKLHAAAAVFRGSSAAAEGRGSDAEADDESKDGAASVGASSTAAPQSLAGSEDPDDFDGDMALETASERGRRQKEEARRKRRAARRDKFLRKHSSRQLIMSATSAGASIAGASVASADDRDGGDVSDKGRPASARSSRSSARSVRSTGSSGSGSRRQSLEGELEWLEEMEEEPLPFDDVVAKVAQQAKDRLETEKRMRKQETKLRKDAEASLALLEEMIVNEELAKKDLKQQVAALHEERDGLVEAVDKRDVKIEGLHRRIEADAGQIQRLTARLGLSVSDRDSTRMMWHGEQAAHGDTQTRLGQLDDQFRTYRFDAASRESALQAELDSANDTIARTNSQNDQLQSRLDAMIEAERTRIKPTSTGSTQVHLGGFSIAVQTDVSSFDMQTREIKKIDMQLPKGEYYYMPANEITMTPRPRPWSSRSRSPGRRRPQSALSSGSAGELSDSDSTSTRPMSAKRRDYRPRSRSPLSRQRSHSPGDRRRADRPSRGRPPVRRPFSATRQLEETPVSAAQAGARRPASALASVRTNEHLQARLGSVESGDARRGSYDDVSLGIVNVRDDDRIVGEPGEPRKIPTTSADRSTGLARALTSGVAPRPSPLGGRAQRHDHISTQAPSVTVRVRAGSNASSHGEPLSPGYTKRDAAWGSGSRKWASTTAQSVTPRPLGRSESARTIGRSSVASSNVANSAPTAQMELVRALEQHDRRGRSAGGAGTKAALHIRQSRRLHPMLRAKAKGDSATVMSATSRW